MQLRIGANPTFKNLLNRILIKEGLEFYSIRTSYLFWSIKDSLVWRIVKYANENMPRFWSIGENRRQMENQTLCFIDDDSNKMWMPLLKLKSHRR
jgi:hypothetical protein